MNQVLTKVLSVGLGLSLIYTTSVNASPGAPGTCPMPAPVKAKPVTQPKQQFPKICPAKQKIPAQPTKYHPSGADMAFDAVIGRPVMATLTVLGVGLFIVSFPFTALSNSIPQAAQSLIVTPADATFSRCLGCPINMAKDDPYSAPLNIE